MSGLSFAALHIAEGSRGCEVFVDPEIVDFFPVKDQPAAAVLPDLEKDREAAGHVLSRQEKRVSEALRIGREAPPRFIESKQEFEVDRSEHRVLGPGAPCPNLARPPVLNGEASDVLDAGGHASARRLSPESGQLPARVDRQELAGDGAGLLPAEAAKLVENLRGLSVNAQVEGEGG